MLSTVGSIASQSGVVYNKYNVDYTRPIYWYFSYTENYPSYIEFNTYPDLVYSRVSGKWSTTGTPYRIHNRMGEITYNKEIDYDDEGDPTGVYYLTKYYYRYVNDVRVISVWKCISSTQIGPETQIAGTFIASVSASDGTYPVNGIHTDGYWYIRIG